MNIELYMVNTDEYITKCRFISHSFIYDKDNDLANIDKYYFALLNILI